MNHTTKISIYLFQEIIPYLTVRDLIHLSHTGKHFRSLYLGVLNGKKVTSINSMFALIEKYNIISDIKDSRIQNEEMVLFAKKQQVGRFKKLFNERETKWENNHREKHQKKSVCCICRSQRYEKNFNTNLAIYREVCINGNMEIHDLIFPCIFNRGELGSLEYACKYGYTEIYERTRDWEKRVLVDEYLFYFLHFNLDKYGRGCTTTHFLGFYTHCFNDTLSSGVWNNLRERELFMGAFLASCNNSLKSLEFLFKVVLTPIRVLRGCHRIKKEICSGENKIPVLEVFLKYTKGANMREVAEIFMGEACVYENIKMIEYLCSFTSRDFHSICFTEAVKSGSWKVKKFFVKKYKQWRVR